MDTFWEFCAGTRIAKAIQSWKQESTRPASPIVDEVEQGLEVIQTLYNIIDCGNIVCLESTENTTLWNEVRVRNRTYLFCSEPCYHEWLNSPQ